MTSIVYSAALQAPIALSNPSGSLAIASDVPGITAKASPVPNQGVLSLVGNTVRLALALSTLTGSAAYGSSAASVIAGLVTPKTPTIATLSMSGLAPSLTVSSSGGSGFMSDPYSTYTQYYVDGVNGNDSWNGTSATATAPSGPKKTIQAGVNLLVVGGTCLNILSTGVYSVSAAIAFPTASGTSPTSQVVIRGLPSYTSAQMPQIVFAPAAGFYINQNSNAVSNLTFWKLDLSSSASASSPGSIGLIQFLSQSAVTNLQIYYCRMHNVYGGDLQSCLHVEGPSSTGMVVKYTYMYSANSTDGQTSDNAALILDYQVPAAIVDHCDFLGPAGCAIFMKRCAPQTSGNGWTISNCTFRSLAGDSILMSEQGAGDTDGFFDTTITNCFFDNCLQCIRTSNTENTLQSSRISVTNCTSTNTCGNVMAFRAMTAIDINSNIWMATTQLLELQDATPFVNTIARCNFNAYLTSTGQSWYMDEFGTNKQQYTSLSAWQAATGRAELSTPPDANSIGFTTASLAANFPNNASGDWTLSSSSALKGIGLNGVDPGYNKSNCGPGWT